MEEIGTLTNRQNTGPKAGSYHWTKYWSKSRFLPLEPELEEKKVKGDVGKK